MSKWTLLVFFLLPACSSFQTQQPETVSLRLLPTEQGPAASVLKQKITFAKQDEQHQFIAAVRLEEQKVQMVALLPTGQYLFSLDYEGKTLKEENFSQVDIPSKEIFTVMQFALWPESIVREYYPANKGWLLEFSATTRVLANHSGVLLKINYEADSDNLEVENFLHGSSNPFKILIETLEKTLL